MTLMFPKPKKPARGTSAAKDHMDLVAQLPCACCGASPVQVHHCIHGRYSQSRASDFDTIPLCPWHHDMLHLRTAAWKAAYGLDVDFLPRIASAVARLRANTIGGR